MGYQITTLLDATTSAAATGSWYETNAHYTESPQLNIFCETSGGTAGDYYLEASPDPGDADPVIVCIAPFAVGGPSYYQSFGNYSHIRVQKKANSPAFKALVVNQ